MEVHNEIGNGFHGGLAAQCNSFGIEVHAIFEEALQ
jgi:hypothetical protein